MTEWRHQWVRSINQFWPISQSINQSISQSINQSIHQSISQSVSPIKPPKTLPAKVGQHRQFRTAALHCEISWKTQWDNQNKTKHKKKQQQQKNKPVIIIIALATRHSNTGQDSQQNTRHTHHWEVNVVIENIKMKPSTNVVRSNAQVVFSDETTDRWWLWMHLCFPWWSVL